MDLNIKNELDWQEISYGRTNILCGKSSASPKGPDLAKDQICLEFYYHPLRGTALFVLCFVIYFHNYFLDLRLSNILDVINEVFWGK